MDTPTISPTYGKPKCPLCGNTVGDDGRCLRGTTCLREARERCEDDGTLNLQQRRLNSDAAIAALKETQRAYDRAQAAYEVAAKAYGEASNAYLEKKAATVRPAPRDRADASDTHTKIGNGHGGFEHPSNETACRLPSRSRRVDMNVEKVTCPKCVEVCLTMFGQP